MSSFGDLGSIRVVFTADLQQGLRALGQLNQTIADTVKNSQVRLREFASSFDVLGTVITAALSRRAFSAFVELDRQLENVRQRLGQTQDEFRSTRAEIARFAAETRTPVTQLAESLTRTVQQGRSLREAMNLARVGAQGAKAALTETGVATEALITAMRSFREPAESASRVMAQLVTAGVQSRTGFDGFARALAVIGPEAASVGATLGDTLAVLRTLTEQTGDAELATQRFRSILTSLIGAQSGSSQDKALRSILGTTPELALQQRGLVETLRAITEGSEKYGIALNELLPDNRALIALIELQRAGFTNLEADVQRFAKVTAADLTAAFQGQKNTIGELLKETGKLANNTLVLAMERNRDAIVATVKSINDFVKANQQLVTVVVEVGLVLSSVVLAMNLAKLAALAASNAFGVLASSFGLVAAASRGTFFTELASMAPRLSAAATAAGAFSRQMSLSAVAVRAAAAANAAYATSQLNAQGIGVDKGGRLRNFITGGFAAGQAGASAAESAAVLAGRASARPGGALDAVGQGVVPSSTRIKGALTAVAGSLATVTASLAAAAATAYVFFRAGNAIGESLIDQRSEFEKTRDSVDEYIASVNKARADAQRAAEAQTDRGRLDAVKEDYQELRAAVEGYSAAITAAGRAEAFSRAQAAASRVQAADPTEALIARQRELQGLLDRGASELAAGQIARNNQVSENTIRGIRDFSRVTGGQSFRGGGLTSEEEIAQVRAMTEAANAQVAAAARARGAIELLTVAYTALGVPAEDVAKKVQETTEELAANKVAIEEAAKMAKDAGASYSALAGSSTAVRVATEGASAAIRSNAEALDNLERASKGVGLSDSEARIAELGEKADAAEKIVLELAKAYAELAAKIAEARAAGQDPGAGPDKQLQDTEEQRRRAEESARRFREAQNKAVEESRRERQRNAAKERDETVGIEVETLRNQERFREAEELQAKQRLDQALRAADEIRNSEIENAGAIADAREAAARRAYGAERDQIERNDRKRRDSLESNVRLRKKAEEDADRAERLAEVLQIRKQIRQAILNGNVRQEIALREQLTRVIAQSGDRVQELIDKDDQLRRSVSERVALLREELNTRARLGGRGRDGFGSELERAESDLAGSSDASTLRGSIRQRFRDASTQEGAKELFAALKQILTAQFQDLQARRGRAAQSRDSDQVAELDEAIRNVFERARIIEGEFSRARREIGGGPSALPEAPRAISGRRLLPGEQVAPGTVVVGPQTGELSAQGGGLAPGSSQAVPGGGPAGPVSAGVQSVLDRNASIDKRIEAARRSLRPNVFARRKAELEALKQSPIDFEGDAPPAGVGEVPPASDGGAQVPNAAGVLGSVADGVNRFGASAAGLVDAVSGLGNSVLDALNNVVLKMEDATAQLNANTVDIRGLMGRSQQLRIEGREVATV